jgi:hypothetical protein
MFYVASPDREASDWLVAYLCNAALADLLKLSWFAERGRVATPGE